MPARTHKIRPQYLDPTPPHSDFPRFQPIPRLQPVDTTLALSSILGHQDVAAIAGAGSIIFHSVGDTGGITGTDVQETVAASMEQQFAGAGPSASFFYHLGDVVYYNGESYYYHEQFYQPYRFYPAPIVAIAGNHDGDLKIQRNDPPDLDPSSLFGFFQNFCDLHRERLDSYRDTMTQPYVYWTLKAPFVTIIGLYSNVDGLLDGPGTTTQEWWLGEQLKAAASDDNSCCTLVAVHHPPYSLDNHHGGYDGIRDAIDRAATRVGAWPHAVLSGHVHNYQRFTRMVGDKHIPYLVAGAGGYARTVKQIHKMNVDPANPGAPHPSPIQTSNPAVSLQAYNDWTSGFLRATIDGGAKRLTIEYFAVPIDPTVPQVPNGLFDSVTLDCQTGAIVGEMNPGTSGSSPQA